MPTFLKPADIAFFQRKNVEIYKDLFFPVKVYKVKRQQFNNVYGENPNKQYDEPYSIEAYIPDLSKWENYMTKFGMDEVRSLLIYFSLDLLREKNVEWPGTGDQIEVQNDYYLVTQTNPVDYGSNLQIPLSHIVEVKRIRYEKPSEGTTVISNY